ncbi:MAG: hypothetical protein KGL39_21045 [Patescibacteria group bacterium]|nr:hypothetical protein [Patescibacteria group bacterium]
MLSSPRERGCVAWLSERMVDTVLRTAASPGDLLDAARKTVFQLCMETCDFGRFECTAGCKTCSWAYTGEDLIAIGTRHNA